MLPALATEETEIEMEAPAPVMKGVTIPLPGGFRVPNDKSDGEEFEILVKASKQGDQLQLISADGYDFAAAEEEVEMEDEVPEEAALEDDDEGEGLMSAISKFREGGMS